MIINASQVGTQFLKRRRTAAQTGRPSVLCWALCRIIHGLQITVESHLMVRHDSTSLDSNVIQKEPIPDGRPTALRKSGKSILSQSAVLRSSRPAAPVCGHSAKYPWLRGSMPAKQLHSFSFPFGYEPRCRSSASSAWSAGARLRCRLHGIKCSNTLFRVSRRWSI